MIKIAPSILSADFGNLADEIKAVESAGADIIHLDIMDGHFVPNISFGIPVVKSIIKYATIPVHIHLMIYDSEFYAPRFWEIARPIDIISIHSKAEKENTVKLIKALKDKGLRLAIAYNPDEPDLPYLKEVSPYIDEVLIMSVNPGFGGQEYIVGSEKIVAKVNEFRFNNKLNFEISVDGGINNVTGKLVINAGCDILVAGNYIFKNKSYKEAIDSLRI